MIDSRIIRRGRFDHVIKVDYADEDEVLALLGQSCCRRFPNDGTTPPRCCPQLASRPLSDVTFVVREGARLAARAGRDKLGTRVPGRGAGCAPSRTEEGSGRRIGFVDGEWLVGLRNERKEGKVSRVWTPDGLGCVRGHWAGCRRPGRLGSIQTEAVSPVVEGVERPSASIPANPPSAGSGGSRMDIWRHLPAVRDGRHHRIV